MHHRKKTEKKSQELKAAYQVTLQKKADAIVNDLELEKERIESMRTKKCRSKKAQEKNDKEVKAYDDHQNLIKALPAYNRKARRRIAFTNNVKRFLIPKFTKQQADAISHAEPIELDAKQKEKLLRI